jgi:hypothetical protein
MGKIYKVSGKEDVLGRQRNIYITITKKAGVLKRGKVKYIKCDGKFIKLSVYLKKATNARAKAGRIVKISKKLSVINNISKIKDIKIRNLLEKKYSKNAKIYFISSNKKWGGGFSGFSGSSGAATGGAPTGHFRDDIMRNHDQPVNRARNGIYIDNLSIELHEQEAIYNKICNIEYVIMNDIHIRPYVEFSQNKKMFIKFYWSYANWLNGGKRMWFQLPLHISNFAELMRDNSSGHIHITSEMNVLPYYNINKKPELHENAQTRRTHTYLRAETVIELLYIINMHGETIFSDWFYDASIGATRTFNTYFTTENGIWVRHNDGSFVLGENERRGLGYSINNLYFLVGDIFSIIHSGILNKEKIYMNGGNISRSYIRKNASRYINYIPSQSQIEWEPFSDTVAILRPDASTRFRY